MYLFLFGVPEREIGERLDCQAGRSNESAPCRFTLVLYQAGRVVLSWLTMLDTTPSGHRGVRHLSNPL